MTAADERALTPAQLRVLTCPFPGCGRLLVRPLGTLKAEHGQGWLCRILGHTGLMNDMDVQQRFLDSTPESVRRYEPGKAERQYQYAMQRGHEAWQTTEALERAKANAKAKKGRKR